MGLTRPEAAELLNVSVDASPEAVQAARRSHARLWHPDRQSDPAVAEFASERMARINEAADVLMQPVADSSSSDRVGGTSTAPSRATTSAPQPRRGAPGLPAWASMTWAEARPLVWRVVVVFALAVTVSAPFVPNLLAAYALALIVATLSAAALVVTRDQSDHTDVDG